MHVDLTVTISVILGVSAILAPVFTAMLNNHHKNKIRKQDRKERQRQETIVYKRKILEQYLQKASVYVHTQNKLNSPEYAEAYSLAYLYVPEAIRDDMKQLDALICDHKYESYYPAFIKVQSSITSILQSM